MSKFGVLVMGPAGAGKVCAVPPALFRTGSDVRDADYFLFRPNPTPAEQQAILLLCKP